MLLFIRNAARVRALDRDLEFTPLEHIPLLEHFYFLRSGLHRDPGAFAHLCESERLCLIEQKDAEHFCATRAAHECREKIVCHRAIISARSHQSTPPHGAWRLHRVRVRYQPPFQYTARLRLPCLPVVPAAADRACSQRTICARAQRESDSRALWVRRGDSRAPD